MTRTFILVSVLLILGSVVTTNTQETCPAGDDSTVQLRFVVQQLLVDVTTQYFADTAIGSDGFPLVDASLRYGLFDLFEERYGSGTSTAEWMAGLLDILGASLAGRTVAIDHLAAVIGLSNRGDYESAREETVLLIYTALSESDLLDDTVDYERLTLVQVEIVHTVLRPFFVTIRNSLTTVAFERYLNLAVGSTLALVMDTTGSMSAEIAAARDRFINIIATTKGTTNQPLLYVLSPYNDPGYGPVTVTSDPDEITAAISALTASGGGDLPELAGIGIYNALLASSRRSVLFHITDAPVKDVQLESRIIALALVRKIRIVNLMTQPVSGDDGQVWYNRLSRATGGLTTVIQRTDIESVTQLFNALTAQGQVILAFNTFTTLPSLTIPIDRSLESLTIRVAGVTSTAVASVTMNQIVADGTRSLLTPEVLINANGMYLFRLTGVFAWAAGSSLELDFAGAIDEGYSVEVAADTVFGTISHIKQSVDGSFISVDQYRAGSSATIETTIFGDVDGVQLTHARLQAEDGSVLLELDLERCRNDEYYVTPSFIIPDQRFFVVVVGVNADGLTFQRSDPCAITPLVANIAISPVLDQIVVAGETITVTTTVSNNLEESINFNYDVSDAAGYVTATAPLTGTVLQATQQVVTITITVPVDAQDGSVSRVLAIASPNPSTGDFLFISFNVIVKNDAVTRCSPFLSERGGDVRCTNGFEAGSICELTCNSGFAANGPITTECVDGSWTVPRLQCQEVGFRECQGYGDPHYRTFDGRSFDFMGTCIYTLVEAYNITLNNNTAHLQNFQVQVENEHRGGNTRVSWFKQAFVRLYGLDINFRQGRKITVNGIRVNLPFSLAASGLNIELSGSNVILTTRFGLEIRYNGRALFVVRLSAAYASQVQGLCGDMNGDPSNDLTLPGAEAPSNEKDYGNYFEVGGEPTRCISAPPNPSPECADREIYEQICGIIDRECFADCREQIPTPTVLQNCVFDMCVTGGSLVAYEEAIADYAQQCQLRGIRVCDFRDDPPVTPTCPPNSHFEHEGIACPNTCRNPIQATRCAKPKVSGCVCDEGFVLSDENCVPQAECGCSFDGQYYLNGQSYLNDDCSIRCECNGGTITCSENSCGEGETCQVVGDQRTCQPESFATCNGNGDPHYLSFDGTRFDFMGVCTYTFVRTIDTSLAWNRQFSVEVENEHRNGVTRVSWLKAATFSFFHSRLNSTVRVVMNRDDGSRGQALVTGLFPTGLVTKVTAYADEAVDIQSSNRGVVIKYGSVTVQFKNYLIAVTVPSIYQNRVTGLCGTFNDNGADDLTNSSGDVVTDVNQFGESFQVGECENPNAPPPNDPPCTVEQQEKWSTTEFCGVITAIDGPFAACAAEVDLTPIYENCLYDLCLTDGDLDTLSEFLTLVAGQCSVLVGCDWRQQIPAVAELYVCPENSVYSGCASGCPATCFDPLASTRCGLPTEEGCVCKLGYVMHNGKCVEEKQCGCFTTEYGYVEQGFSRSNADCTRRCSCKSPGNFVCEAYACEGLEQCIEVGDNYRCIVPAERCMIWGSYVKQFDGFRFNFDRIGRFVAVASDGNDDVPPFVIEVVRGMKHPVSAIRTYKTVIRYQYDGEFQVATIIPGGQRAYVNQVRLLPGSHYRGVRVLQQGLFTVLMFEFGDLVVRAGFHEGVIVSAGGLLLDEVSGLCGSWNNDISDDVTDDITGLLDGVTTPASPDADQDDDGSIELPQGCSGQRFLNYINGPLSCGLLNLDASILNVCHGVVEVEQRLSECVNTLSCVEVNFLASLESSIIGYLTECIMESDTPPVLPIRDNTGLQYVCPANSHYVQALTSCPRTCADRDGSICEGNLGLTRFSGVEGCECDEGFIWSGDMCVQEEYCGCVSPIDGIYFKHGECYTGEGCSQRCQCRSGAWECEDFRCYKSQTCGIVDGLPQCISVDKCKLKNGGCQDKCHWNSTTDEVFCSCSDGYALTPDLKKCVAVADGSILNGRCNAELNKWRISYKEWKTEFNHWQNNAGDAATCESSCAPTWQLEGALLGEATGSESCSVYWTEWFDSDDPDGCGDDETIERLRDYYPDLVCDRIITMEKKIESAAACVTGVTGDIILRSDDRVEGLFCDNADQPLGIRCPDYSVRFLCAN